MTEDRNTIREQFAAFVTIFSLLVTIIYSNGEYDAWDLMLALIVFFFLTFNLKWLLKKIQTSIIAIFGYALSLTILIGCFDYYRYELKKLFETEDFGIFVQILGILIILYVALKLLIIILKKSNNR